MARINWGRVVAGGVVAGLVWIVLGSIITAYLSHDFVAAVPGGRLVSPPAGMVATLAIDDIAMGVWSIWLYAAIQPRYGAGTRTAVAAGVSWWIIAGLTDATWASFGFFPPTALLPPEIASLPALIIAVVVRARVYKA
jgi:hypothetical protein